MEQFYERERLEKERKEEAEAKKMDKEDDVAGSLRSMQSSRRTQPAAEDRCAKAEELRDERRQYGG